MGEQVQADAFEHLNAQNRFQFKSKRFQSQEIIHQQIIALCSNSFSLGNEFESEKQQQQHHQNCILIQFEKFSTNNDVIMPMKRRKKKPLLTATQQKGRFR